MKQDIWNAHRKAWINSASGEVGSSCPVDNSRFHLPNRMVTQQEEKSLEHHKSLHQNNVRPTTFKPQTRVIFSSKNISSWSQSLVQAALLVPGEIGKWFTTCLQCTTIRRFNSAAEEWAEGENDKQPKFQWEPQVPKCVCVCLTK